MIAAKMYSAGVDLSALRRPSAAAYVRQHVERADTLEVVRVEPVFSPSMSYGSRTPDPWPRLSPQWKSHPIRRYSTTRHPAICDPREFGAAVMPDA